MTREDVATFPPLTRSMHDARMTMLDRLSRSLKANPVSNRDEFTDMMMAAFREGGLDVRDLAGDMGYSMSTCYRWVEGRTSPHASQWPLITTWVVGRIDAIVIKGMPA